MYDQTQFTKQNAEFTGNRGIAAFSITVPERNDDRSRRIAQHTVSRTTGVDDWHEMEILIGQILRTFMPERDHFATRMRQKSRFTVATFAFEREVFPTVVNVEKETVTVTFGTDSTMAAFRKRNTIHFRLSFQDPKVAKAALERFNKLNEPGGIHNGIGITEFAFTPGIAFTTLFSKAGVLSHQATQLLGTRVITEYDHIHHQHRVNIVPQEGEKLVVFDGQVQSVLGLSLTEDEKRAIRPEDRSIFAALILPDGMGAVLIAYRIEVVSSGPRRRPEHFIGARHDPDFVLEYHEENSDVPYDDCDEPSGGRFSRYED